MFQNVLAIRESYCNSCFQLIYGILSQTPKKYTFQGSAHPYLQNDVILEFVLEFDTISIVSIWFRKTANDFFETT